MKDRLKNNSRMLGASVCLFLGSVGLLVSAVIAALFIGATLVTDPATGRPHEHIGFAAGICAFLFGFLPGKYFYKLSKSAYLYLFCNGEWV